MRLPRPSTPFEKIEPQGEYITLEISATHLVLPTGTSTKLPLFNEWTIGRDFLSEGRHSFTDDLDLDTGLQNMATSWVSWFDSSSTIVDFILFTHRPKSMFCVVNSDGTIISITLFPGNGTLYHGQITYPDLAEA